MILVPPIKHSSNNNTCNIYLQGQSNFKSEGRGRWLDPTTEPLKDTTCTNKYNDLNGEEKEMIDKYRNGDFIEEPELLTKEVRSY